ncbi:hypothetical protein Ddye_010035 [Dipteronia dyeriana]|uniref:Uncharacterized protein n=1 Tax=Dipteronia dyeriana TaxID=168575 RepID=A0AAE0CNF6_9ROSI|nr:hypothetical protein Ddye_010035 [Dipteronia dyeriana]
MWKSCRNGLKFNGIFSIYKMHFDCQTSQDMEKNLSAPVALLNGAPATQDMTCGWLSHMRHAGAELEV